jgi:two-component system nitrate/nitrite response regulator NarL
MDAVPGAPGSRVRVLIVDDHPLFLEGVERAVRERPEYEVVAAVAGGREALQRIRDSAVDVALVDLRMPDLDGLALIAALRRDHLRTRVILLSASADPAIVYDAMAAGAAGYFAKDADRERVVEAIAAVARGATLVDEGLHAGVFAQLRSRAVDDARPALSKREREVLGLVADGLSAPAIARRLVLAVPTVKTHLAHLYDKLGVSDRAAAVAEAMRRGLLE